MTTTRRFAACCVISLLLIGGCASKPVLPAHSAVVPTTVDLSGNWILRTDPDAALARKGSDEQLIMIPPEIRARGEVRRRPSRRSSEPAVRVFLETGEALKITQTAHGLFISYDRSVVEEYTFGENRLVSIGPIEAQRVSGWDDEVFVVQTLDANGAILTESWRLEGDVLVRDIAIRRRDTQHLFARQRFDRS